jgi:hypothetical protein
MPCKNLRLMEERVELIAFFYQEFGEDPESKVLLIKKEIFTKVGEYIVVEERTQGKAVQSRKGDSILSTNATVLCYTNMSST